MTTVVVVGVLHLEVHWTADLKDLGLNTATNGNFFMMCPPKITKMEVSQRERKGQDEKSPKSIPNFRLILTKPLYPELCSVCPMPTAGCQDNSFTIFKFKIFYKDFLRYNFFESPNLFVCYGSKARSRFWSKCHMDPDEKKVAWQKS